MLEENKNIEVINNVIKLQDGTLFLRQKNRGQFQFEYLTGQKKISPKSIFNFKKNIKRNKEYCDKKNINYLHVIFPCKAVAYRNRFKDIGVDINPIVTEEHLNVDGVYYPNLDDIAEDWFLKTDTHCSYKGRLSIIKDIMKHISIVFPDIAFDIRESKSSSPGDLGRMIDNPPVKRESISFKINSDIHHFALDNKNVLSGNTGGMLLKVNTLAPIKKRVAIFGDSFFVGTMEILSIFFEEVFYMREAFIIQEVANCLEPDLIFTGNAERYLHDVKDAEKTTPYFIKLLSVNADMSKLGDKDKNAFLSFFEPKKSDKYKNWFLKLNLNLMLNNGDIDTIKALTLTSLDINMIRDYAVSIEDNNTRLAYDLMLIAYNARPNGPFIKQKVQLYKQKIDCNLP
tara:strand:- start:1803 stop:2999 length:1197 start_codon:yes stop_codon:yes gene_type:complete